MRLRITQLFHRLNAQRGDVSFILFLLFFQLLFIFQGLDFADEGNYATMYQQIFSSPEQLQYMFMYWLQAIIGGIWLKLFPSLGLLGIRIVGVFITTTTLTIVYINLKKYVKTSNLRIGVIIATLILLTKLPLELYYNNLSVLFWVASSLLIFKGLKEDKLLLIFISGLIVGLNIFIRLPNILGGVIVFSVFYYGWSTDNKFKKQIYQATIFVMGFITAVLIVGFSMNLIGHLKIYLESINIAFNIGSSQEDTHNMARMSKQLINMLIKSLSYASIFLFTSLLYAIISQIHLEKIKFYPNERLFLFIFVFIMAMMSLTGKFTWVQLVFFVIGISFLANIYILINRNSSPELKLLSFLGLILLIVFPYGSASGLLVPGKYALWLSLPLGIEVIQNFSDLSISFSSYTSQSEKLTLSKSRLRIIPRLFIYISLLTGLIFAFSSPYFDRSSRLQLRYSIDHVHLKGILTTKERARAVQELLNASSDYVKPGDYVLAYGDIPMYHYLTKTKPYFRNPWPGLYTSEMLLDAIHNSLREIDGLPVVILQKVNTLDSNWPENADKSFSDTKSGKKWNNCMLDFIEGNSYKIVWENSAFAIMKSDIKDHKYNQK